MSNVTQLPGPKDLQQIAWEKAVRQGLTFGGWTDEESRYAWEQIKPIYERFGTLDLRAANMEDLNAQLGEYVRNLMTVMGVTIVLREAELYRLRGHAVPIKLD